MASIDPFASRSLLKGVIPLIHGPNGSDHDWQLQVALQLQTSAVEDSYGPDLLHLTVIKGHLTKWLGNAAVLRWLAKHRPEYLKEFQRITDTEDIAEA